MYDTARCLETWLEAPDPLAACQTTNRYTVVRKIFVFSSDSQAGDLTIDTAVVP